MTHEPEHQSDGAPTAAERRRDARLRKPALYSSVGPVMDLSRNGMRVLSTRRLRGEQVVTLFSPYGTRVELRARAVWCRRHSFRKHEIGFRFVDVPNEVADELAKIATASLYGL